MQLQRLFRRPVACFFLTALLLFASPFEAVRAAGELMVAPTRVVFEGRARTAQVTLVNTSAQTATYRIAFVRKRMLESGGFEDIEQAAEDEFFADPMVRFSPRQVTLGPGQGQVVRLLLSKPPGLADGEYRSHLLFRSIPDLGGIESMEGSGAEGINIRLVPVLAISIPVIVRHGSTMADVQLNDLRLDESVAGSALSFSLSRGGNRSVFGDVTALYLPPDGSPKVIGQANGVAVYTPLERRAFRMPLHLPSDTSLQTGVIRLTYRARPEEGGTLLAESELALP